MVTLAQFQAADPSVNDVGSTITDTEPSAAEIEVKARAVLGMAKMMK